jgi:glyoxylase-like metal-dependent hydrolase (beta-lactamase superfamily II)
MRTGFKIGEFELIWLNGGVFELDGGAMFGVVPKALWQKKYPANEENAIRMHAWPILVRTPSALVLIESGLGNKLTDKQQKIYCVHEEWQIIEELSQLGISRNDIDMVILTHYDFDHAGGVVMQNSAGTLELTFPRAEHVLQKSEWDSVVNPNSRNVNTYWPINNELLRGSPHLKLVVGEVQVVPGITVIHTGGHNKGHQIIRVESKGQSALHLGDLLPTHVHANPLWVMAYDHYPLDTIALKEQWIRSGTEAGIWFTFYHDAFLQACKFGDKGAVVARWDG